MYYFGEADNINAVPYIIIGTSISVTGIDI